MSNSSGGLRDAGPTPKVVREIVGYHVTGPEDDHLASAEGHAWLSLGHLVQEAGAPSVPWEVLTARDNDSDVFDEARKIPLPPVLRFRVTLEVFPVGPSPVGQEKP